jgi:hypothetical protein
VAALLEAATEVAAEATVAESIHSIQCHPGKSKRASWANPYGRPSFTILASVLVAFSLVSFRRAPFVQYQRQQSTDKDGMETILKEATGQYRILYALLAGCGPPLAGEALGLEIGKHVSQDCRTLYIRQKAKRPIIQPWTKTQCGTQVQCDGEAIGKDVDLCTELAGMLRNFIGSRTSFLRNTGL